MNVHNWIQKVSLTQKIIFSNIPHKLQQWDQFTYKQLFSLLKHTKFASFISIIKLTGKQTHVNWAYFHDKPLHLFWFYNWTANWTSLQEAV